MHSLSLIFSLCVCCAALHAQVIRGVVLDDDHRGLEYVLVSSSGAIEVTFTDATGAFELELALVPAEATSPTPPSTDSITFQLLGYTTRTIAVQELLREPRQYLSSTSFALAEATVRDRSRDAFAQTTLRDVDGVAIYAGRKNELILPDKLAANLASNNAREIFKGVAGLTVWESDAGGLQLSIGARGLNPNRSSNFNTRQNGFDISADALGYPESYYTPPAQALQRIELVRGAASLQYGTQFGGLLNFKLKEGVADRRVEVVSEQTMGSYGFFNSFNSVGGTVGKVNYYGFGQFKRGTGWRANSGYQQSTGYLDVHYQLNPKLRLGIELTRMAYRAQQPGGLLDFEFEQSPRISKRSRNWFDVDWGLAALHLDYEFSERTKLNARTFVLDATRQALGELGPINRPDPGRERNLVDGAYRNFGQELRLLHRYTLRQRPATLIIGTRVYSGLTQSKQGLASDGSGPDFSFLHPEELEGSAYRFPSRNFAAFAEQLINLSTRWSLTPGLRYEYIQTAADGYYRQRVMSGGEVLLDRKVADQQLNKRDLLIEGLGSSFRPNDQFEAYANASQNYRAINFSDLVVLNPNLLIDSNLTDERGYNLELGFRGSGKDGNWRFDASLFLLNYANRIGIQEVLLADPVLVERAVSMRTNIGRARLYGLEFFAEADLLRLIGASNAGWQLRPFLNASIIRGRYLSGASAVVGKDVELVPPLSLKTGIAATKGRFGGQVMLTYVATHFTDATNANFVADATRGPIPAYTVLDASAHYSYKMLRLQVGANNLSDTRYFTRRATGYPGPGIIPAEARTLYAGLRVTL